MDAPYTLSIDVFDGGGGYMGAKNMLSQIVFYSHISPSFYTVSAKIGVASGIFHDIIVYIFYVLIKFR